MRIAKTKIALALGVLALTAQVQADQLADIKATPKLTSWWAMTSISPRRWQNRLG